MNEHAEEEQKEEEEAQVDYKRRHWLYIWAAGRVWKSMYSSIL